MPYNSSVSIEDLKNALSYDPETGVFVWKISPAKNVKAGTVAGTLKRVGKDRNGAEIRYCYLRLKQEVPAARVAWAFSYGEWPSGKILFVDKNPANLRLSNLKMANCLPEAYDHSTEEGRIQYLRDHREAFPKAWKNTHLRSKFGITLAEYLAMATEQGNVCAICAKPETEKRGGKVKALAVDHNHTTGAVRQLLCTACNKMVGLANEDRGILLAAVKYLDKHGPDQANVTPLERNP